MNLVIREYSDSDFEIVNKIMNDNFSHGMVDRSSPDNVKRYVCDSDNGVVGFFILTEIRNVVRGFYYYLLDYVCTDIEHHGKGIGSFMTEYICKKADKDKNIKYIQLTSSSKRVAARHLYQKYGFEKYDTDVFRRVSK